MENKFKPDIFKGLIKDLKKVTWPTRRVALQLSLIVVVISILLGIYIGLLDFFYAKLLKLLISL